MFKQFTTLFLLAALTWSCGSDNPTNPANNLSSLEKKLVEADNKFTLKLFRELVDAGPDTNIFVSPLSVSMALGMTLNGAANQTQADMAAALEFAGFSQEEINQAYRDLIDYLISSDSQVVFSIANSIWYRQNFGFEAAFLQSAENYFDAQVTAADFAQPDAAAAMINQWVDENTNGKIQKILNPADITNDSVMYLLNAIYFLGTWQYEFDKALTYDSFFGKPGGSQIQSKMMIQTNEFDYFETDDFQAIDLPYGAGQFSMTLFLPDLESDVETLLQELTNSNWNSWLQSFSRDSVVFEMPKMKLEYEVKLNDVLTSLGMGSAFSVLAADFTNLYKPGGLFISTVRHKTFLQVDEEGTEAAAVTIVAIETTSIGHNQKKHMRVDRPFVMAIRERQSGTILFMGKITAPLWEE